MPTFILKGRDKVQTRTGGVATIVITIIALMYAALKFSHLTDKHNPMMSSYFKEDYYKSEDLINLSERRVRLAFTIEDHLDPKKQKSDPKYVKWLVRQSGQRNGEKFQRILPYHKCTDEDYNEFYPVQKSSRVLLK